MFPAFASAEMPYSSQVAVQSQEFEAGGNQDVLPGYSWKELAQTAVTGTGEPEVRENLYTFIQGFQGFQVEAQGHMSRKHGLVVWWFLRLLEPIQTVNEITKWFQRRFRGEFEAPSPGTISNRYSYGIQTLPSRVTGFRGSREIADMSVMAM